MFFDDLLRSEKEKFPKAFLVNKSFTLIYNSNLFDTVL